MEGVFRATSLLLFGITVTWFLSVLLGRLVARRGVAFWVWDRSGAIGRILIVVGFGLAVLGLSQGAASTMGSSMLMFGAVLGMAGIWLILPGP
jgi:hypothetical protein